MKEVLIENWSIVDSLFPGRCRDPYKHEFRDFTVGNCLHGKVYGHKRIEDGHRALTTPIRTINGDLITTDSETVYRLGAVNPNFYEPKEEV